MNSPYPTPHTVGWHTANTGGVDAEGNPTVSYTPALSAAGTSRAVMGWGSAKAAEPQVGRVEHDLDLFVPPGFTSKPSDVVDVPGSGQFEVVGFPLDWTKGPFGFTPGMVVQLRRVTG